MKKNKKSKKHRKIKAEKEIKPIEKRYFSKNGEEYYPDAPDADEDYDENSWHPLSI